MSSDSRQAPHRHKWKLTTVESSMIKTKESVEYKTFQCIDCGYFPNSDFERNRPREKCVPCLMFAKAALSLDKEQRAGHVGRMLQQKFMAHVVSAHPEINVLNAEDIATA